MWWIGARSAPSCAAAGRSPARLRSRSGTRRRRSSSAPANHHEVAGVHAGQEVIGRPVGLEVRIAARAGEVELVFVGVDHVGVGCGHSGAGRLRPAHPASARRHDRAARRTRRCAISSAAFDAAEMPPFTEQVADADPRIALVLAQRLDRLRRRRGVVAQAELPVRIDLAPDRLDARAQPARVGVVDRREDADERLMRQRRDVAGQPRERRPRRACGARPSARRPRRRARRCPTCAGARARCAEPSVRRRRANVPTEPRTSAGGRRHSKRGSPKSAQALPTDRAAATRVESETVTSSAGSSVARQRDRHRVPAPIGPLRARDRSDGDVVAPGVPPPARRRAPRR